MQISSRYVAGSLLAWMACLNRKQIIAVSLETAMQNVGIAVLVLQVIPDDGYQRMMMGCSVFTIDVIQFRVSNHQFLYVIIVCCVCVCIGLFV